MSQKRFIQSLGQLCLAGCIAAATNLGIAQVTWTPPQTINTYAAIDDRAQHDTAPQISAGENGSMVAVWRDAAHFSSYSIRSLGLKSAYSSDYGQTWTTPATVALTNESQLMDHNYIEYGGNGRWFVTFDNNDILYSTSTMDGQTWSPAQEIASPIWGHFTASDGEGNALLLVRKANSSETTVFRSTDRGETWQESGAIAAAISFRYSTYLTYGGDGKWYLMYIDDEADVLRVLTSSDFGENWAEVGQFSARLLRTAAVAGDTVVIVTGGLVVNTSVDGGATFVSTKLDDRLSRRADLAYNDAGQWVLFAQTEIGFQYEATDVYTSSDGFAWTHVLDLNESEAQVGSPDVIAAADGAFVATWHYLDEKAHPLRWDADILVSRSYDGGATWQQANYLNTTALTDTTDIQDKSPKVTAIGDTLMANWVIYADDIYTPSFSDYSLVTATSIDQGETWSEMTVVARGVGREENLAPVHTGGQQWVLPYLKFVSYGVLSGEMGYVTTIDNGATWSEPKVTTASVMASDGAGTLLAAGSGMVQTSTDNGQTWQPGANIGSFEPALAIDREGEWLLISKNGYVLWVSGNSASPVSDVPSLPMRVRDIRSDGAGRVVATGTIAGENLDNIYTSVSTDGGLSWSPLNLVRTAHVSPNVPEQNRGSHVAVVPRVLVSETGQWTLVMHERTVFTGAWFQQPLYVDSSIWLSVSNDGGVTWSPAVQSLHLPIWNESSFVGLDPPDFALTGERILVLDARRFAVAGDGRLDFDIYMQKSTGKIGPPTGPPPVNPPAGRPVAPPGPPPTEPPVNYPPPGVDTSGPNLTGIWAPVVPKYTTNKKGVFKGSIKATFAFGNTGNEQTQQKSVVRFYLSADRILDPTDAALKPKNIGKLKPGKGKSAKVNLKKLAAPVTGQYLIAVIDADHTVIEGNELDNIVISAPLP